MNDRIYDLKDVLKSLPAQATLGDGTLNGWLTKASNKGGVRPVSAFIS